MMTLTKELRKDLTDLLDKLDKEQRNTVYWSIFERNERRILHKYEPQGLTQALFHNYIQMLVLQRREDKYLAEKYGAVNENFGDC